MKRPITLGVLALLLAAPPNWAAAEGADPCALLARQFDAAGYDNGVGRRWTTDQTDNVPIYGVLGANALPAVDVSGKLYDLAGKKVGGYDKLPSPWTDAIDLDAEMAKLLGGRKFGDALANIEFGGMLSAVSVPTEPERLVLFQSAGTMNCLVWSTFVAEGGHWRPDAATVGPDEAHDNCYGGGSVLKLSNGYYIMHTENAEEIDLIGLGDAPDCNTEIKFDRSYDLDSVPAGDDPELSKAMGEDLRTILAGLQEESGGDTTAAAQAAARFTPEVAAGSGFEALGLQDEDRKQPLPALLFDPPLEPDVDPRPLGMISSLGHNATATPEGQEMSATLATIPIEQDSWNELEGGTLQLFGYRGRHFIWTIGTPHIGWRELPLPGFAVYERVGTKLVPRLGGHGLYILQYAGAQP